MNDYCDLIQTLDHYVSPQRKSHILSVRETAARILWDQGLDDLWEKAQIAALLHDITKEFSLPLQLEIIKKYNLPLTDEDLETPATLHAFTGAAVAKDIYPDLVDDAVYQADLLSLYRKSEHDEFRQNHFFSGLYRTRTILQALC